MSYAIDMPVRRYATARRPSRADMTVVAAFMAIYIASSYFGAAPVDLSDYIRSVTAQSIAHQHPTAADLQRAFHDLLVNERMLARLGPAVNSGRGLFLYGPPGNGKTSIAERITAGRLVRELCAPLGGSAGGHGAMAGARIPLLGRPASKVAERFKLPRRAGLGLDSDAPPVISRPA